MRIFWLTWRFRRGGVASVRVKVQRSYIVDAAPLVARFKGQHINKLLSWVECVGTPICVDETTGGKIVTTKGWRKIEI